MAVGFNTYTTNSTTTGGATSITSSHTPAGSDRLGIACVMMSREGSDLTVSITGATWNGVAMTDTGFNYSTGALSGSTRRFTMKFFYLINPAASAQNVVGTISGGLETNARLGIFVTSWTGADQTTPVPSGSSINDTGNPKSNSATATRSGSVVFGQVTWGSFGMSYTGSGTTISGGDINFSSFLINAVYNTGVSGALTQSWNDSFGGGTNTGVTAFVIQPPQSGPANLKTYNTNPLANIKSIDTNLIANVKSLNTNT